MEVDDQSPYQDALIPLAEAARAFGYRSDTTLRKGVREGKLTVVRFGPRATLTTLDWVQAYISSLSFRGRARGTRRT